MTINLSLAIAAKGAVDPRPFFMALTRQESSIPVELDAHVVHDGGWPDEVETYPNTELHECPVGTSITRLWGLGLSNAESDYAAVLDINCPPAPGWLEAAARAIADAASCVWGPVIPDSDATGTTMLAYLAEYGQFHPPIDPELNEIPGNNLIVRRDLLNGHEALTTQGFEKTFMVWKLSSSGVRFEKIDSMAVMFGKKIQFGPYVVRRAVHGRCFAARRLEQHNQPSRVLCLVGCPILPLLRLWRIYRWARNRSELRSAFWRLLPGLLVSEVAWSWGEFQGYSVGAGDSCNKLS